MSVRFGDDMDTACDIGSFAVKEAGLGSLPDSGTENGRTRPTSETDGIVKFSDAGFSYDGRDYVFRHLDLTIRPGEFLCILGGNGSGKSTLVKLIDALLLPDEGTVTTLGSDTRDPARTFAIRSQVGMVFQNPDDQIVATLVENDVAFGPENLGIASPELRETVTEALSDVGLSGFELRETDNLSGGQKQRVALAGALAMHPAVLVLDEASSMLDPRGRKSLMKVVRSLNGQGMTVVLITHYMEEAVHASCVVVLDDGAVVMQGTPEEIFSHASELQRIALDIPFATKLSLELRERGIDVGICLTEERLKEELCSLNSSM